MTTMSAIDRIAHLLELQAVTALLADSGKTDNDRNLPFYVARQKFCRNRLNELRAGLWPQLSELEGIAQLEEREPPDPDA